MQNYNRDNVVEEMIKLLTEDYGYEKVSKKDTTNFAKSYEQAVINITSKLKVEKVENSKGELVDKSEKLSLNGFLTFEVKEKPAGTARNPKTGETKPTEAKTAPKVKFTKTFKDAVNK